MRMLSSWRRSSSRSPAPSSSTPATTTRGSSRRASQAQERAIDKARSDIAVLKAERAHLARPERIEPLARALGLGPATEQQLAATPDEALARALGAVEPAAKKKGELSGADAASSGDDAADRGRAAHPRRVAANGPLRTLIATLSAWRSPSSPSARPARAARAAGAGRHRPCRSASRRAELRAPRHRRPQRPPAGDRRRDALAVRRSGARARSRRGGREARRRVPRSRRRPSCARPRGPRPPLRLDPARSVAAARRSACTTSACRASPSAASCGAPIPAASSPGHVLGDVNIDNKGVARHRALHRRDGRRRSRARRDARRPSRPCACRSTSACSMRSRTSLPTPMRRYRGAGRRRPRHGRARRARCWRQPRCPASIPAQPEAWTRAAPTRSPAAPTSSARSSRR